MVTTVRKPAARRPAPAAKARPARKETPAKPAPAAKKAAPARQATEAKKEQLAAARAVRSEKVAAAKAAPTEVHPVRKDKISAHDVARAWHTALMLQFQYAVQEGEEIAEAMAFVAPIMASKSGLPEKSLHAKAKVDPEDRVIDEFYDLDVVKAMSISDLRTLATDLAANGLITETKLKSRILEQMEEAGLFREEESSDADEDDIEDDVDEDAEEDEEDDDSDEDDDTEDVEYSREDLKGMTLKELQEIAEANEYDWKGLDKASLIEALLADPEEEDEEESGDEDDEEAVEIDPDELPNMDLDELLELCEQIGLKVPAAKKKNKKAVIQLILDELGDDEDE